MMSQSKTSSLGRDKQHVLESAGKKAATPNALSHLSHLSQSESSVQNSGALGDLGAIDWDYFSQNTPGNVVPAPCVLNGDLHEEEGRPVEAPGDDMENYFRANVHLMEQLHIQDNSPGERDISLRLHNIQAVVSSQGARGQGLSNPGQGEGHLDRTPAPLLSFANVNGTDVSSQTSNSGVNRNVARYGESRSEQNSNSVSQISNSVDDVSVDLTSVTSISSKSCSKGASSIESTERGIDHSVEQLFCNRPENESESVSMTISNMPAAQEEEKGGSFKKGKHSCSTSTVTSQENAYPEYRHNSADDFHLGQSDDAGKESNLHLTVVNSEPVTVNGPLLDDGRNGADAIGATILTLDTPVRDTFDHNTPVRDTPVHDTPDCDKPDHDIHVSDTPGGDMSLVCDRCGVEGVSRAVDVTQWHTSVSSDNTVKDSSVAYKIQNSDGATESNANCRNRQTASGIGVCCGGAEAANGSPPPPTEPSGDNNNDTGQSQDNDVLDFIDTDISSQLCNGLVNSASYRTAYSLSVDQSGLNDHDDDDSSSDEGFPHRHQLNLPLAFVNGDVGLGDDSISGSSEDEGLPRTRLNRQSRGEAAVSGAGASGGNTAGVSTSGAGVSNGAKFGVCSPASASVCGDPYPLSCNIVHSGNSSSSHFSTGAIVRSRAFPCPAGCALSCTCNSALPKIHRGSSSSNSSSSNSNNVRQKNNFYKEQHQNNLNDAHEAQVSSNSNSESYQSSPFYSPDMEFLDFDLDPVGSDWLTSRSEVQGHDLGGGHNQGAVGNLGFVSREHDIQDVLQLDPAVSFNNLDFRFEEFPPRNRSFEQPNMSRQTSTSNFDNDENSFQFEIPQDLEEDEQTCRKETDGDEDEDDLLAAPAGWAEQTARQINNVNATQGHGDPHHDLGLDPAVGDLQPDLGGDEMLLLGFLERQEMLSSLPGTDDEEEEEEDTFTGASNSVDNSSESGCLVVQPTSDVEQLNHMKQEKRQEPRIKKTMIWKEHEAFALQVKQIGTSACGPTAVINVLQALKVDIDQESVSSHITARLRAETAPVAEYLLSRSVAGTTADDLIAGIQQVTEGRVQGRFFQFHPSLDIKLLQWLAAWIHKGAVPLATLNLQCGVTPGGQIPDAWHHQMIYGVGPKGVYLTNPLEVVSEEIILSQLCSESLLLIRREDIVKRWNVDCDLKPLTVQRDGRWRVLNVLGQVINVIREEFTPHVPPSRPQLTSHVTIPAVYKPGITLFVHRSDSQALQELLLATELS